MQSWSWADIAAGLRLKISLLLLRIFILTKFKLWTYISRRRYDAATLTHMLANEKVRWLSKSLSISQFRALTSGPVDGDMLLKELPELFEADAKCERVRAADFRASYVVQSPKSTHVIYYVHGGGFVSGSASSVSSYLLQLRVELQTRGLFVDVFAVDYDFAPEFPYPHALHQVVSTYEHLQAQGKPVFLMGDSAGGNLCFGLLQHLVNPHPRIPAIPEDNQASNSITALCLASPWVNLRDDIKSGNRKSSSDCLDESALASWRDAYLGLQSPDQFASPLGSSAPWKRCLPPYVLLMSGDFDLFLGDIQALAREICSGGYQGLELEIAHQRGHVWNLVDYGASMPTTDLATPNEALKGVRLQADWIVKHCRHST